jgi:hypothetical protein
VTPLGTDRSPWHPSSVDHSESGLRYTRAVRESPKKTVAIGLIALALGITASAVTGKFWVTLVVGIVLTSVGVY